MQPASQVVPMGSFPPRNILLPLAVLVIGAMAVVAAVVLLVVYRQDVARYETNARLLRGAIEAELEAVRHTALDSSWWDAALEELRGRAGPAWAERELGPWLARRLGFAWTFVLDGNGRTVYASERGEPRPLAVRRVLGGGVDRLVAGARARRLGAASGLLAAGERPALVGVSAILPAGSAPWPDFDREASLVIARPLDGPLLREIGARLELDDLAFVAAKPDSEREAIALASVDGTPLGHLTWRAPRLLGAVLPPLAFGLLAVAAFGLVALREAGKAASAIADSEQRFRDFAESASDWFWEWDDELRFSHLAERFEAVTNIAQRRWLGRRLEDLAADETDGLAWHGLREALAARRPFRDFTCAYHDGLGRRRIAQLNGRPVLDEAGRLRGYRGTGSDITARVAAEERIRFLAQHDALTELPNRVLLGDRLAQALALARRRGRVVAVLCLDLDDFKAVNDSLGHAAGDALLREAARRLKDSVREADTVARLGGDEFVVVQTDADGREAPARLGRRLQERLREPYEVEGETVLGGASIGVACFPEDGAGGEELLRHADLALYRAKADGRGRLRFYRLDLQRQRVAQLARQPDSRAS